MPKTWDKKSIYHSSLVGRTLVLQVSAPRESKYKDKPPFAPIKVHGDESEYWLTVENKSVGAALERAAAHGGWVTVQAGGRDEDAWLKWVPMEGAMPQPTKLDAQVGVLEEITGFEVPPRREPTRVGYDSIGRLMVDALRLAGEIEGAMPGLVIDRNIIAAKIAELHVATGLPLRAPVREH